MTASPAGGDGKADLDLAVLLPELAEIGDDELRAGVEALWQRLWHLSSWTDVMDVPVASHIATPQVNHTRAVTRMALAMADIVSEVHGVELRRDLLVAAALVQDACKMIEYEADEAGGTRRTEIGRKLGHAAYGAAVAIEVGLPLDVVNVILSHSPDASVPWGSVEARILVNADQADVAALGGDRFIRKMFQYR